MSSSLFQRSTPPNRKAKLGKLKKLTKSSEGDSKGKKDLRTTNPLRNGFAISLLVGLLFLMVLSAKSPEDQGLVTILSFKWNGSLYKVHAPSLNFWGDNGAISEDNNQKRGDRGRKKKEDKVDSKSSSKNGDASGEVAATSKSLRSNKPPSSSSSDTSDKSSSSFQPLPPPLKLHLARSRNHTVAYVVPLWLCTSINHVLADAAGVLRHSIHQNSKRNPESGSQYDYKMYALVLKKSGCSKKALEQWGYQVLEVESPIDVSQIEGEYARETIEKTRPGGAKQFIQLLAHTLVQEPIVNVLNLNSLIRQPLDHLYHSILYGGQTKQGKAARQYLLDSSSLERPPKDASNVPDVIDHFIVRDYPHAGYGRKPVALIPGGMWIARRNETVAEQAFAVLHKGNYSEGAGDNNGWGNKGYSRYFTAGMGMANFYAYFMDELFASTLVELNSCRYNHNGKDNLLRNPPRFSPTKSKAHFGKCRSGNSHCDDCMALPMDQIYTIVYDETCFSPWACVAEGKEGAIKRDGMIDSKTTNMGKFSGGGGDGGGGY